MQPPQRRAQGLELRRRHQQVRRLQGEDALAHQGQHGDDTAGERHAAQPEQRRPVQKRIGDADGQQQGQEIAHFIKALPHAQSAELEEDHRVQRHHRQGAQAVFWKRDRQADIEDRHKQLCCRVQLVSR